MLLSEARPSLHAELHGGDAAFRGVSTDTRTVEAGQLFVALRGPHFDAHDYIERAAAVGAAGAVVEHSVDAALPYLKVTDSRDALARLAKSWRARFSIPLIAVTGSNGKTTVKEMLASILGRSGPVLATRGNLNNEIGVPLTLFNLGAAHRSAVIEMGANHPGEIAQLCEVAAPTIAVITGCAPAHLEGFGSIEGVARAKGEIVSALPADGVAILNADDPFIALWRALAGARSVVTFGLEQPADVSARLHGSDDPGRNIFDLITPRGEVCVNLPLPGRHNVMNALTAAAAALASGARIDAVLTGLQATPAVKGRLVVKHGRGGARILDDTYNANPTSLKAAIDVLTRYAGRHWLVLGDMGELGGAAEALHREAGEYAARLGVERLYGIGALTRHSIDAFGDRGRHFDDSAALIAALAPALEADVSVLVKGSRAMQMERVVNALAERT